jgi:hypothetical protein
MVFPHRQALRAWLLPFRYIERTLLRDLSQPRLGDKSDKVTAGGTPADPATLVMREDPDGLPSSHVRLRRRCCSHSGISMGLF